MGFRFLKGKGSDTVVNGSSSYMYGNSINTSSTMMFQYQQYWCILTASLGSADPSWWTQAALTSPSMCAWSLRQTPTREGSSGSSGQTSSPAPRGRASYVGVSFLTDPWPSKSCCWLRSQAESCRGCPECLRWWKNPCSSEILVFPHEYWTLFSLTGILRGTATIKPTNKTQCIISRHLHRPCWFWSISCNARYYRRR